VTFKCYKAKKNLLFLTQINLRSNPSINNNNDDDANTVVVVVVVVIVVVVVVYKTVKSFFNIKHETLASASIKEVKSLATKLRLWTQTTRMYFDPKRC
jgi:signal transduction histidine kinase